MTPQHNAAIAGFASPLRKQIQSFAVSATGMLLFALLKRRIPFNPLPANMESMVSS